MVHAGRTPTDYMIRVAADEMECCERADPLVALPHVLAVLNHPAVRFLMRHAQNFSWTCERAWRRLSPALPQGTVRRRYQRPRPAADSFGQPRPKIWIDVTNTYRTGFGGGIGRVALQLADAAARTGLAVPVVIENGRVYEYFRAAGRPRALSFEPGIVYVVVDSFWEQIEEYRVVCTEARSRGAKVVACLHDVIPLYYPLFCRADHIANFGQSLEKLLDVSDAFIAVSDHARRQVLRAIDEFRLQGERELPSTSFHLGADGHVDDDESGIRPEVRDAFARPRTFVSVGTLEPRKGYAVTLDAFDELWRADVDCTLVLIGRLGWISKSLQRRIVEHPRNGTSLHWITDANDAELTFAYRAAHCLIQASVAEGFGLPVVEARYEGTPVIASDIDIFRELSGEGLVYFDACDAADLRAKIEVIVAHRPHVARDALLRWDESLEQMVARITQCLVPPAATVETQRESVSSDHKRFDLEGGAR